MRLTIKILVFVTFWAASIGTYAQVIINGNDIGPVYYANPGGAWDNTTITLQLQSGGTIEPDPRGSGLPPWRTWFLSGTLYEILAGSTVNGDILFDNFLDMTISGGNFTTNNSVKIDRLRARGTLNITGGSFLVSPQIARFQGDIVVSGGSFGSNNLTVIPSTTGGAIPTATFIGSNWTFNDINSGQGDQPLTFTGNIADLTGTPFGILRGTLADGNTFRTTLGGTGFTPDVVVSVIDITVPNAPTLTCEGFQTPFDEPLGFKRNVKRAIPLKIVLSDTDGVIADTDLVAPPVVNVLFGSQVFGEIPFDDADLLPNGQANDGNVFSFDPATSNWEYILGTSQFTAPGTYTVFVSSGDTNEYLIPDGACTQTFERLP